MSGVVVTEVWHAPTAADLKHWHVPAVLDWHDYAELWLNFPLGRVLDFGCGDGAFLARLVGRASECHGVDVDPECVAAASARPGLAVHGIGADGRLPYPDEWFDTIVTLEVLEHVLSERRVLTELTRVLKCGGHLLLTTPHKGWLTWLDAGNVKSLVPRLHRWIHRSVLQQPDYYEKRFGVVRRGSAGLCGDFCTGQPAWHRHYRYEEVRRLAPLELQTVASACYFPAYRALLSLGLALRVCTAGRSGGLPHTPLAVRARLSRLVSRGGDQLVILFRKAERAASPPLSVDSPHPAH